MSTRRMVAVAARRVLCVLLGAAFAMAGVGKLAGSADAVALFAGLGVGAWFRYLVGSIEITGAILLLCARPAPAALVLTPVMLGACAAHLGPVPGNPLVPATLLVVLLVVGYWDRARLGRTLATMLPVVAATTLAACAPQDATENRRASLGRDRPHVLASTPEEAGRYLITVAGCNDCHTDGYLATNGDVPESKWLLGSSVGFTGPWGTTYPANLRHTAARMSEAEWVKMLATRKSMPPMPWPSVAAMSDSDRVAIYRYIRSLGDVGTPAPAARAPGVAPTTPWIDFMPRAPAKP